MMSIGAGANTELGVSDMRTKVLVKHKADIHLDEPEVGAHREYLGDVQAATVVVSPRSVRRRVVTVGSARSRALSAVGTKSRSTGYL